MKRNGCRWRLEYQAERLQQVLASHNIQARVLSGTVTPRLVRFHLLPARGTKIRTIARLAEEIAMSLGVKSARVRRCDGQLDVEIPRDDPTMVPLRPLLKRLDAVPAGTAVLGRDDEGTPLLLRIPSPDVAHVLICGTTGSGKTVLARTMITSLALTHSVCELGLVLIDPKGRGYQPFERMPHLARDIAITQADAQAILGWLVALMEQRDRAGLNSPRVMCFIDELADLIMIGGNTTQALITRLTQRGRTAGIHLIACTQKPTVTAIGSLTKSNFPVRLVGSVTSPEDAKVSTGLRQTEAEKLLGRGDFLLVIKGQVHRFQAAYVSPTEIRQVVQTLRGNHPLPGLAEDNSEQEAEV
ncbi:MAG: DNA translocase FtsK [Anaerolineae bacterium]